MTRRPNPLVPLGLFGAGGSRRSTSRRLLIYGALYTMFTVQGLFLQGVVGYTATAAGVVGVPTALLLTVGSTRVGALAGRHGSRPVPGDRAAGDGGRAALARPGAGLDRALAARHRAKPATYLPPASTLVDILPFVVLYGIGSSLVVAPLTSTLMSSVPVSNAGLASAINNAIQPDRPAAPLGADLRRRVRSFYASLATGCPGL